MKKNKMKAADADPCLYIFQGENPRDFLALALYVDDILIIDNNIKIREDLTKKMKQKFKIVDLGRANWILGTRITYTETGSIKIDQEKYLQEILERYGMKDFQAVKRILKYLQGTKEIGIQYSKKESTELR